MIKLNNINKSFDTQNSKIVAVKSLSLELPSKGLLVLLGKSGSGKSTLLNIIGGLDDFNGEITYDEKTKVKGYNPFKFDTYRSQNIGYIFQDFYLDEDITIVENIRRGLIISGITNKDEQNKRINESLKAVGLLLYKRRLASSLSLGQKQRIAIARAISIMPKILLADEPTGNLDSENSKGILEILKKLSKQMLVIVVTHNENLALTYADTIYRLVDGEITSQIKNTNQEINEDVEEKEKIEELKAIKTYSSNLNNLKVSLLTDESKKLNGEIKVFVKDGKNYIYVPDNYQLIKEDLTENFKKINEKVKKTKEKNSLTQVNSFDSSNFNNERKKVFFLKGFFKNSITKKQKLLSVILSIFIAFSMAIGISVMSELEATRNYSFSKYNEKYTVALSSKNNSQLSNSILTDIILNEENGINGLDGFTTDSYYLGETIIHGGNDYVFDYFDIENQELKDDEVLISDEYALEFVNENNPDVNSVIGEKLPLYNQNGILKEYKIKDVFKDSDSHIIVGGMNNREEIFNFDYFNDSNIASYLYSIENESSLFNSRKDTIDLLSNLNVIRDSSNINPRISNKLKDFILSYSFDIDNSHQDKLSSILLNTVNDDEYNIYLPLDDKESLPFLLNYLIQDYVNFVDLREEETVVQEFTYIQYPNYTTLILINEKLFNALGLNEREINEVSCFNSNYKIVGTFTGSNKPFIFQDKNYLMNERIQYINTEMTHSLLEGTKMHYIFLTDDPNFVKNYYKNSKEIEVNNLSVLINVSTSYYYYIFYAVIIFVILIELLLYGLLFRSRMAYDLKAIGIYRSLGMRRIQIVSHYLINTFITLTLQFLIPYFAMLALIYLIFGVISSSLFIILGIIIGYILVFISVLIPLGALLLKTPHNILVKHDI